VDVVRAAEQNDQKQSEAHAAWSALAVSALHACGSRCDAAHVAAERGCRECREGFGNPSRGVVRTRSLAVTDEISSMVRV
jgi:hypothetical protein